VLFENSRAILGRPTAFLRGEPQCTRTPRRRGTAAPPTRRTSITSSWKALASRHEQGERGHVSLRGRRPLSPGAGAFQRSAIGGDFRLERAFRTPVERGEVDVLLQGVSEQGEAVARDALGSQSENLTTVDRRSAKVRLPAARRPDRCLHVDHLGQRAGFVNKPGA
jgi:hypothetical protein